MIAGEIWKRERKNRMQGTGFGFKFKFKCGCRILTLSVPDNTLEWFFQRWDWEWQMQTGKRQQLYFIIFIFEMRCLFFTSCIFQCIRAFCELDTVYRWDILGRISQRLWSPKGLKPFEINGELQGNSFYWFSFPKQYNDSVCLCDVIGFRSFIHSVSWTVRL